MLPQTDAHEPTTLRAEGVSFRYPGGNRHAVDGVTLGFGAGELLAVAGPNGSGKSTLLGLLLGFLRADSGVVLLGGRDLRTVPPRDVARSLCAIPQSESVLPGMTVRELALLGRHPHARGLLQLPGSADMRATEEALQAVGIAELADRRVESLSGGERQLARIARAVAQDARLMLMDEPTAALDLAHQQEIMRLVRRFCDERGMGVAVVTHDLNLAAAWADRIVLMRCGACVAEGTPREIIDCDRLREVFGAEVWTALTPDGVPSVGLRR